MTTENKAAIGLAYETVEIQTKAIDRLINLKTNQGSKELDQAILRQKESMMWLDSWIDHAEDYG